MVRRFGPQAAIKYQVAIDAHRMLGYDAVGFGVHDLQLPSEILLAQLTQGEISPFVSANVRSIFDEDFGLSHRFRVLKVGGMRIGVTQVLGQAFAENLQNVDFEYQSPETALEPVVKSLKSENCDFLILLANTTVQEARALGETFTDFDFVVVAGDSDPPEPEAIESGVQLIELGHKGMYVGILGFYENSPQVRYQRIPLDGRFKEAVSITRLLTAYQDQLKTQGLAGLGLRANPHPTGRRFTGSKACADCHSDAYEIWEATPHAHATETLVKLPLARQFDPECISCHVTGWHPSKYYPYEGGYLSLTESPHLLGNGCENCHGPGSRHVAAEAGAGAAGEIELLAFRKAMKLDLAKAENTCLTCHDIDNSPDFHDKGAFLEYWEQIKH